MRSLSWALGRSRTRDGAMGLEVGMSAQSLASVGWKEAGDIQYCTNHSANQETSVGCGSAELPWQVS